MPHVFVSRPTELATEQSNLYRHMETWLSERDLKVRTVGVTDFTNKTPLVKVGDVMRECSGAIIMGFRQMEVRSAIEKPGTKYERARKRIYLPTPWNQIESGIAFTMHLPMLIVKEKGVVGGIFEMGSTDQYVHSIELPDEHWISSPEFNQPLSEWWDDVKRYASAAPEPQL